MEVWEIRGAEYVFSCYTLTILKFPPSITFSPVSVAAKDLVSASRGLSIRFPRFIKVREDKSIEQANTPIFLVKLWKNQGSKDINGDFNDEGELIDTSRSSSDSELEGMDALE